jgi:hypothetical protein
MKFWKDACASRNAAGKCEVNRTLLGQIAHGAREWIMFLNSNATGQRPGGNTTNSRDNIN